jgi:hypothetical protein
VEVFRCLINVAIVTSRSLTHHGHIYMVVVAVAVELVL